MVAVAVAAQVDGDHPELAGEPGRNVRPPVGVRAAAVDEHEATAAPLTPRDVVDGGAST